MKTVKQISAEIARLGKSTEKLAIEVQEALIDVAGHMVAYGEASLGQKLLDSIGNAANRKAVAEWMAVYTAYRMKDGKPACDRAFLKEVRLGFSPEANSHTDAAEAHMAALREEAPRWDAITKDEDDAAVKAVFDAAARVEALIATINKKAGKGDCANADIERYLRAALAQYKSELVNPPARRLTD